MNIKSVRNMMSFAGIVATFAVAGFAQDGMKARIAFPFTAQGQKLEAGVYSVRPAKFVGNNIYTIFNIDTQKTIFVSGFTPRNVKGSAPTAPRLTFQCNEGQYCALKQVWDGSDRYSEVEVKKGPNGEESLMEVALIRNRR